MRAVIDILKKTYYEWAEDKVPRLGAALAYYAIFAIAPLLVIALAIAGSVYGEQAAQGQLAEFLRGYLSDNTAGAVQELVANMNRQGSGALATVISSAILLVAATGLFNALKDALDTIWEVAPRPDRTWGELIKGYGLSVLMVIGVGVLLLALIAASTAAVAASELISEYFALTIPPLAWQLGYYLASFVVLTFIFAMIFKFVPDVKMAWRNVWLGAAVTAVLFTVGVWLIGLYLGRGSATSAYGAAGSLVALLLFIYYSAQIFFFGAEFTQVYAHSYGTGVQPDETAIPLSDQARAHEGIPRRELIEARAHSQPRVKGGEPPLSAEERQRRETRRR